MEKIQNIIKKFKGILERIFFALGKSYNYIYFYFKNSAGDYNNLFGGFARILKYAKKEIGGRPALVLSIYVLLAFLVNLWLSFFATQLLGAVYDYFWCRALITHKFVGVICLIKTIKVLFIVLEIIIGLVFAFYFNKLKKFYFGEKAFYMDL